METLSLEEFVALETWTNENLAVFPGNIGPIQKQFLSTYRDLLKDKKQSLRNLKLLREAMGFLPKSERGSQEKHPSAI